MVKVKLRVPLSSAPRETSSPLANPNPLRSAPDYSDDDDDDDDDEPTTPVRDGATPEVHANAGASDAEELLEDEEDVQEDDDEDQEADELDELDELEADDDALSKAASGSTPKRRGITLKSKGSGGGESASPSNDGSASPHSGASKLARRGNLARIAQVQAMSVEELDALPAAKRRKTAKARGAAGPGRGWRKGLTKGQKPVYELPTAETTPATFGNTANARASPAASLTSIKAETPTPSARSTPLPSTTLPRPRSIPSLASVAVAAESSHSKALPSSSSAARIAPAAPSASTSIKIVSGPGGQTFTGDLSAKAGTAKNPGFRYPPLPSSRAGPPVQPIARIPTAFQPPIPLERNARQPRRWSKAKREVLSVGGRPWSVPVFYGGEDRGYDKKVDAPAGAAAVAGGAAGAADKVVSKAGTPSAAAAAAAPAASSAPTAAKVSPVPSTPTPTPAAGQTSTSTAPTTMLAKGGSPLPPPKHLNGLNSQTDTNWRGQSPAFLFGAR